MTPIFPFESLTDERRTLGLALAVLFGAAFGFVLERAGFGRAQKLVGQFYGYDMTVLKVMFTGIVTAMVGVVVLSGVGLLDLETVLFGYPTFLWPMIVGGFVLGAGFVISGYCPGTSIVATASGKLDGLATVGGVVVGGVLYAELEPAMGAFPNSGRLGAFTLPQWLGLPAPVVAALVAVLAVAMFAAGTKVEKLVNARGKAAPPPPAEAPAAQVARP
jgi:membrane protein required for beta-lactamase induction